MKLRTAVFAALCIGLVCGIAASQGYAQAAKITVYNPMGQPPPIQMKEPAPRLSTVEGKTIYLVNTGFPNSGPFMQTIKDWFAENQPKVNIVMASGQMEGISAQVRSEIAEKADAVLFGVGH